MLTDVEVEVEVEPFPADIQTPDFHTSGLFYIFCNDEEYYCIRMILEILYGISSTSRVQ